MRPSHRPSSVSFLLALGLAGAVGARASAQRAEPGRPASLLQTGVLAEPSAHVLARPDVARLMQEDDDRQNWPYRYGAVIPTAFSCEDSGVWDVLPSGELVWRLRLSSPGARSLAVLFQEFELPRSGRVFVYDPAHGTVLGAFTNATRQENGMLAVQPVAGDELVIEYVQDATDPGSPRLSIGEVVHDYRGILDRLTPGSTLALGSGCLVDVNCAEGAAYQDIKRSVIMVIAGGFLCSAGMLNNTAEDQTPYFLTANHCGNMVNVVAVFDFERTGCGGGSSSTSKTISGATLLAASSVYDSQLYRLSSAPPQSYRPYYAGWDRGTTPRSPAIGISHPSGLPKKISRDDQKPTRGNTRWTVIWDLGTLEGGSSGSPLFNAQQRAIGPACCVSNFTCNNQWALYGYFPGFWNAKSLGQWLDPLATGAMDTDGFDPFRGEAVIYNGSGANPINYVSQSPPTLGTTWTATVDTSNFLSTVNTRLIGHLASSSGTFLPTGEVLVNTASPRIFISFAAPVNDIATHSNPIPLSSAMVGVVVYSQGLLISGGPLQQTNGVELHLR